MPKLNRTELGSKFNEGARLLWSAMRRAGDSQADVTAKIGAAAGRVNHLLYGDNLPSPAEITALHEAYGIPGESWGKPSSRSFQPPSARAA